MKNYYFKIAFCDQPTLKTKFGNYNVRFDSPLKAEEAIKSKANGWYYAIEEKQNTPRAYKIDDAWLMIKLCFNE